MRVTVAPYDPRWATDFESVKAALMTALRHIDVLAIEHVGSTAVPGLAAKPILDIDIVVPAHAVPRAIAALETVGYTHCGDLGVPDRESLIAPDDMPRRHVYVCVEGCLALRNHLGVRDTLRADAELRDTYAEVKLALAEIEVDGIEDYIAGKNAVVQQILTRAGFTDAERAAINQVNT